MTAQLALPSVGLGCAALAKPEIPDAQATATLLAALDAGIGYFDVAPLYGTGLGERRLGRALAAWRGARPLLSSKVGFVIEGEEGAYLPPERRRHDFTADGVRRSLDKSLERLGVDRLDLVFVHEPEAAPAEAIGALETLSRLGEEGLVAGIGIGSNSAEIATMIALRHPLDAVLIAGRYTLLDRSADALLAACAARKVAVIAGGIFNSGILAAADIQKAKFDYRQASPERIAETRRLATICARFDVPLRAAAVQFAGRDRRVALTLLGAAHPDELRQCLADLAHPLPDAFWEAIAGPHYAL